MSDRPLDPIDALKSVQEIMRHVGTYHGETDGIPGPLSQRAFEKLGVMANEQRRAIAKLVEAPPLVVLGRQRVRQMTSAEVRARFGEHGRESTLQRIVIPQLIGKPYYEEGNSLRVTDKGIAMHPEFGAALVPFFKAVEDAGLLKLVLTFDGIYNNRLVRGGNTPSRHAWGIAMDINQQWNGLGAMPAATGWKGTVRPLVAIAESFGLFWGGNFDRQDGMHFELGVKI